MELGSILLIAGIIILAIFFISQPLIKRKPSRVVAGEAGISPLIAEQEHIINALLELDFDYKLGKIPSEDYPMQRKLLLSQGARIMQQLDTLKNKNAPIVKPAPKREGTGVLAQGQPSKTKPRGDRSAKRPLTTPDDDLEILLAARRRERIEKAGGFCPQCGNPTQQSDNFCPRCGAALSLAENKS